MGKRAEIRQGKEEDRDDGSELLSVFYSGDASSIWAESWCRSGKPGGKIRKNKNWDVELLGYYLPFQKTENSNVTGKEGGNYRWGKLIVGEKFIKRSGVRNFD